MTDYLRETVKNRWDNIGCKIRRAFFAVFLTFVRHIPYRIRYWVVVLAWADSTQGEWSDKIVPEVTAHQLLERMK